MWLEEHVKSFFAEFHLNNYIPQLFMKINKATYEGYGETELRREEPSLP